MKKETYLGDGLYASHDGYQFCLRADDNRVYLEPSVLESFERYVKEIKGNYDGAPYCSFGHKTKADCDCPPIAANE
jgi:hypothetical protein